MLVAWRLGPRLFHILILFSQSFDFQDSKTVIVIFSGKQTAIFNSIGLFEKSPLLFLFLVFFFHYLLLNYVTKYSFFEFIQTSPQIVDFACFSTCIVNHTVSSSIWN